jgi:protein TonB
VSAPSLPAPLIVRAQPKYKQNPAPEYPSLARKRGWQGKVVLEVVILADGSVEQVRLHSGSGFALLDKAAIAGVGQWRFSPEMHDGKAVPSKVLVPVNFSLN